jgi:hypothetical protein
MAALLAAAASFAFVLFTLIVGIVLAPFIMWIAQDTAAGGNSLELKSGCVANLKERYFMGVNSSVYVDIRVDVSDCPVQSPTNSRILIDPAEKLRLTLYEHRIQDQIHPVTEEQQTISPTLRGYWTWQITPMKPGEYYPSLIVSIVGDDGEVLYQNERIELAMIVAETPQNWLEVYGSRLAAVLTSAAGVLLAIAAALAAFGVVPRLRLFRRGKSENRTDGESYGSDGGYP